MFLRRFAIPVLLVLTAARFNSAAALEKNTSSPPGTHRKVASRKPRSVMHKAAALTAMPNLAISVAETGASQSIGKWLHRKRQGSSSPQSNNVLATIVPYDRGATDQRYGAPTKRASKEKNPYVSKNRLKQMLEVEFDAAKSLVPKKKDLLVIASTAWTNRKNGSAWIGVATQHSVRGPQEMLMLELLLTHERAATQVDDLGAFGVNLAHAVATHAKAPASLNRLFAGLHKDEVHIAQVKAVGPRMQKMATAIKSHVARGKAITSTAPCDRTISRPRPEPVPDPITRDVARKAIVLNRNDWLSGIVVESDGLGTAERIFQARNASTLYEAVSLARKKSTRQHFGQRGLPSARRSFPVNARRMRRLLQQEYQRVVQGKPSERHRRFALICLGTGLPGEHYIGVMGETRPGSEVKSVVIQTKELRHRRGSSTEGTLGINLLYGFYHLLDVPRMLKQSLCDGASNQVKILNMDIADERGVLTPTAE